MTQSDIPNPGVPDDFLVRVQHECARMMVCAREQLAHVAMHDLRSPLNGIQGWLQVLESRLDTSVPIVQRALDGVRNCVLQQTQILEDTADMLKLMGAGFEPGTAGVDLEATVRAAVAGAGPAARARQIEFSLRIEPGMRVSGEAPQLERALRYVLIYAVRCAVAGERLDVAVSGADEGACIRIAPAAAASASVSPELWRLLPHPPLVWQLAQGLIESHAGRLRTAMSADSGLPERYEIRLPQCGAGVVDDIPMRRHYVAGRAQLAAAAMPIVGVMDGPRARRMIEDLEATGASTRLFADADALAGHLAEDGDCGVLLLPASGSWHAAYADIPCLLYGAATADGDLIPHALGTLPDPCEPLHLAAFIITAANTGRAGLAI